MFAVPQKSNFGTVLPPKYTPLYRNHLPITTKDSEIDTSIHVSKTPLIKDHSK